MSKKYIIRALVWGTLVLALTVITYYNRILFIQAEKERIVQLEQDVKVKEKAIVAIEEKIEKYNSLVYDRNTFMNKIPVYVDDDEIQQLYIYRPIKISNATLIDFSPLSDALPSNLKFNNNIRAKKITLIMRVDSIDQFYTYIDELSNGMRSVYFGSFIYALENENDEYSPEPKSIQITLDYYVFYSNSID